MGKRERNILDVRGFPFSCRRKVKRQRAEKGVSDYDITECRDYITNLMYNILKEYASTVKGTSRYEKIQREILPRLYRASRDNNCYGNVYFPAVRKYIEDDKISVLEIFGIHTANMDEEVTKTVNKYIEVEGQNKRHRDEDIKEAFRLLSEVITEM